VDLVRKKKRVEGEEDDDDEDGSGDDEDEDEDGMYSIQKRIHPSENVCMQRAMRHGDKTIESKR
jgi:hypothetical protein